MTRLSISRCGRKDHGEPLGAGVMPGSTEHPHVELLPEGDPIANDRRTASDNSRLCGPLYKKSGPDILEMSLSRKHKRQVDVPD